MAMLRTVVRGVFSIALCLRHSFQPKYDVAEPMMSPMIDNGSTGIRVVSVSIRFLLASVNVLQRRGLFRVSACCEPVISYTMSAGCEM